MYFYFILFILFKNIFNINIKYFEHKKDLACGIIMYGLHIYLYISICIYIRSEIIFVGNWGPGGAPAGALGELGGLGECTEEVQAQG